MMTGMCFERCSLAEQVETIKVVVCLQRLDYCIWTAVMFKF